MRESGRIRRFRLERVVTLPRVPEEGVLYVSDEFKTATHLCACGCGEKVRTPIGPEEWSVWEASNGPTLRPSIGNWQKPCRSHYLITAGAVEWREQWSGEEVAHSWQETEKRRTVYYANRARKERSLWFRFWNSVWSWLK